MLHVLVKHLVSIVGVGGIFSIGKTQFEAIGAYDEQMVGMSVENTDLSLRMW